MAAGVAKAGASYIHLSGHSGGTGASPLSSIKHVGAPWELGLAEVHQVLLRNDLRDRVVLRSDGGLQTGRDVLIAALLGAEEYAFGTAALVAIGCDMARQCHLDTCPTGHRHPARGPAREVRRHARRRGPLLHLDRRGRPSRAGRRGRPVRRARSSARAGGCSARSRPRAPSWRRSSAPHRGARARRGEPTPPAPVATSATPRHRAWRPPSRRRSAARDRSPPRACKVTTADRSFGAALTGALERGELHGPIHLSLRGAAGQSFGAFASPGVELRLVGQANDYVGKGLSGGSVTIVPEPDLAATASSEAIAGNTVLYGATGGRLHLVGRAGMRFAVRNSGAEAVVEGIGPHGCEYMTGGTVVVLGPVGANFGAGMTGGRAYLYDPTGRHVAALADGSVQAIRLAAVVADREDGPTRLAELLRLLEAHRQAGSALAGRLLDDADLPAEMWVVEPVAVPVAIPVVPAVGRAAPVVPGAVPIESAPGEVSAPGI